jgi:cell division protein FtsL
MEIAWGTFWRSSRNRLKAGWLITSGLIAIYLGAVDPMNRFREVQTQRGTGLGAVALEPISMWHQIRPMPMSLRVHEGTVGGVPGISADRQSMHVAVAKLPAPAPPPPPGTAEDRKTIRTGAMDIVVNSPRDTSEEIRQLAERMGGFLVNSETNGGQDASSASLQIRVPASKFEDVRTEIRKLGLRVESEKLQSEDVTKQYVDQAARLRNLRAQETQYRGILKQAKTVQDTVDVSEKLDEVRGEIEQQQAEFDALSKQVETVALTISLRTEAEAQVFGLRWRPPYQLKSAARQGIDSLGDYTAAMTAFLFCQPSFCGSRPFCWEPP